MKSRSLIIALIIILCLILIGVIILFVALLNNGFKFKFFKNISSNLVINKEYENVFDEVNIVTKAADIQIVNSDNFKIEIYGKEEQIKISDTTSKLNIDVKNDKCNFFCINTTLSKVIVYLPSNYDKKITIKNNYGDVEVAEFDNAILSANLNAGDIKVGSIYDAKIKNNYGDIKINKVNNYVELSNDCGDIKIDDLNINKDSKIFDSLGNIKIGDTNEIHIDAKTSLGDVKINSNYSKSDITLTIDNSCGDIKVNN